jgi:3-deoxy-D-manno-octulosonate 8-phosphate phosphatase (KDO 8-P phosphatase)
MKNELSAKFRDIKVFLFDLEGVLTNGDNAKDKCIELINDACSQFQQMGLIFGIVTAHKDDEFIQKIKEVRNCLVLCSTLDKVTAVDNFLKSESLNYQNVFYMGDDLLDISLLKKCFVSAAPRSARREVKRSVTFVTKSEKCKDMLSEIIDLYKKSKESLTSANKL